MKTKEEMNALKEEIQTLDRKLDELTEGELNEVVGGIANGRKYWYTNTNQNASEHDD